MIEVNNQATREGRSDHFFRKALIVGLIGLLLMIPLLMVNGLANEREREANNVQDEITSKWGDKQCISTPVLAIPYTSSQDTTHKSFVYIMPREAQVSAELDVEMRHRSIYHVPVYTSQVTMKGQFHTGDILQAMADKPGRYDLSRAVVALGVSDVKGFRELVHIDINGERQRMKSDDRLNISTWFADDEVMTNDMAYAMAPNVNYGSNVLSASNPIQVVDDSTIIPFACNLTLLGSQTFGFIGNGTSTTIDIKGNWSNPSFQGHNLPVKSDITADTFDAEWKSVSPDSFVEAENYIMRAGNSCYINLVNPADHYTQTDRSIKYGFLIIGLTLLSIFLIELTLHKRGKSINLLHYLLTGLSLVLFYSLLLSFSELIGFGWSYLIATAMTVVLNTFHFRSVLREQSTALLLGGILTFLYLSVYLLLRMESYALIVGSLWLFAILAFVMFFSAKVMRKD